MQSDCQIYVDPEEDEVFFGCVSEKEKSISAKLVNHAVPNVEDDLKVNNCLDECVKVEEGVKKRLENEQSSETNQEEPIGNDPTLEKVSDTNQTSNTSVELEHNYSTPMKHKIDKSILATPKSIVKADKDGGFLKVLSEIAIVKAEAEADNKKEDEDKENKSVPEIKITEATPEKGAVTSPPSVISTELRRFRIIYNSPRNEDNVTHNSKTFENERNIKNKRLDQEVEVLGSNRRRKSVDLIDFSESNNQTAKEIDVITLTDSPEKAKETNPRPPVRFSKDARKVVEVLKKSAIDDTLNFTIPEINVEEEENSFLSPEPASGFDETIVAKPTPKAASAEQIGIRSKTEEKQTENKIKYFSERKNCNLVGNDVKKCVKRLPLDDKRCASAGKVNETSHQPPPSRIPVFGAKNSKIRLFERVARTQNTKTTTPSNKTTKNSKFNHIESPINAYIHNKPTALVLNIKPEVKKENVTKVWKVQTTGSGKKQTKEQNTTNSAIKLPFVDYKSATPYKIEKRPESRLPRLAPTVYKLIGSNSPKVLRHEGRFYLNSPKKQNSKESTIVADQNEVSVVVSQPAQKSHTIK